MNSILYSSILMSAALLAPLLIINVSGGTFDILNIQKASAQSSSTINTNSTGNVTIPSTPATQSISTNVKVSLSDAAKTAEQAIGANSRAVSTNLILLKESQPAYNTIVEDPSFSPHSVIVDAQNGKVLTSQKLSLPTDTTTTGTNMTTNGTKPMFSGYYETEEEPDLRIDSLGIYNNDVPVYDPGYRCKAWLPDCGW